MSNYSKKNRVSDKTKDDAMKLVSSGFTEEEISDICSSDDHSNNNNDMLAHLCQHIYQTSIITMG